MSESAVTIERTVPGVATVVLDRPDKLNVFSGGAFGPLVRPLGVVPV